MYKRKIMVFSNTVPEDTHPQKTQAFQEGGTVAVSKLTTGETILMSLCYYNKRLHKLRRDSRVRQVAASSSSGNKKIDTFLGLKAGYPLLMTL
jgi:hypothetical protein